MGYYIKQTALMKTEGVNLKWEDEAIREIAIVAAEMNRSVQNVGTRRLNTVIERIVDEISFNASEQKDGTEIVIDAKYVREKVGDLLKIPDLRKFLL